MEGVAGSLPVYAIGTARFLVQCHDLSWIVCLVHNALLTNGNHQLLSVSQFLASSLHEVFFAAPSKLVLNHDGSFPLLQVTVFTPYGQ